MYTSISQTTLVTLNNEMLFIEVVKCNLGANLCVLISSLERNKYLCAKIFVHIVSVEDILPDRLSFRTYYL